MESLNRTNGSASQHSLWNLIMEHVPPSELAEVRSIIGEALIDFYSDLCTEVETWEQILSESLSTRQGSRPKTAPSPLADPPAIKALLKAEIQLLLLSVRERASREGRDGDTALSRYSPSVVSYALGNGSTSPRSSVENRDPPNRPQSRQSPNGSRSSSRLSSASSLEDEIESVKAKLNVSHVDEVVSHLQSVLTDDCEALKMEVHSLQECVEQAHHSQAAVELVEPTVTELKEQRKVIQMDLRRQTQMSGGASPDKAASQGPSRQRTERHASDLGMCRNPAPPSASKKPLPRPPSSPSLLVSAPGVQLSAAHPGRTPGSPPVLDHSAPRLPGPLSVDAPERWREGGRSPDAPLLPRLRRGGSRLGEPSLPPLVPSPTSRPSELQVGQCAIAGEGQHDGLSVDADPARDRLQQQRSLQSGKCVQPRRAEDSTRPLPRASGVTECGPASEPSLDAMVPCPPASQKPANRGQSVARRLGLPQGDRLVSPS
ncbi:coiled-coil domain-containing protein 24 [Sardina pilchardus]|uniref:coiled-coil domain-containing protein 24 n=1 Tax=Sardina pilchardus TaxID=27697 RepID=UPI002E165198